MKDYPGPGSSGYTRPICRRAGRFALPARRWRRELERYRGWGRRILSLNPDEQAAILLAAAIFVIGLLAMAFFRGDL